MLSDLSASLIGNWVPCFSRLQKQNQCNSNGISNIFEIPYDSPSLKWSFWTVLAPNVSQTQIEFCKCFMRKSTSIMNCTLQSHKYYTYISIYIYFPDILFGPRNCWHWFPVFISIHMFKSMCINDNHIYIYICIHGQPTVRKYVENRRTIYIYIWTIVQKKL